MGLMTGRSPLGKEKVVAVSEKGELLVSQKGDTSTEATQLEEIRNRLPMQLEGDRLKVDGSGVTQPVADASALEIKNAIGTSSDVATDSLGDDYGNDVPWSIISLLRGIYKRFDRFFYHSYGIYIAAKQQVYVSDHSGVVQSANQLFVGGSGLSYRNWLLIQNLGKFNSTTQDYEGYLWVYLVPGYFLPELNTLPPIGKGWIRLPPGGSFTLENVSTPTGFFVLAGSLAGIEYTFYE